MRGQRASEFRYVGVDVDAATRTIACRYATDDIEFVERASFSEDVDLGRPGVDGAAVLYFVCAGLSYYKATAARAIETSVPFGPATIELLAGLVRDGLGEFAHRNGLDLSDVAPPSASAVPAQRAAPAGRGALVPFGGGIDSIVTVASFAGDDAALFQVHPPSGPFEAIERAARPTELPLVRCARALDPQLLAPRPEWLQGHVPVTSVVAALALVAALGQGRGEVLMSNERSASSPTYVVDGREVNHQWSKSLVAERLLDASLRELVEGAPTFRSALRDRSELWIAREFARHPEYLDAFLSCNRAFRQDPALRATTWCGECDKCLFTDLVLAPFVDRTVLEGLFDLREPIGDPARAPELAVLAGHGEGPRPWECVGDAQECATAVVATAARADRRDQAHLQSLARRCADAPSMEALLGPGELEGVHATPDRL